MIDSHVHLYDSRYAEDLEAVMARGAEVGVTHYIIPDVDQSDRVGLEKLVREHSCCLPTIGLHPTSVNDNPRWKEELEIVGEKLRAAEFDYCAVGEIGLDLYWSKDYLEQQIEVLKCQLEWAVEYDLPVILHIRDSWDEIFPILEPFAGRIRGVFHSFSGTLDHYHKIEALGGFYVGLGGPITYKNSQIPQVIPHIPLDRILVETDGPYLPPVPYRGQRNESSYLMIISHKIAEIKGVTVEKVKEVTASNTRKLFAIE